MLTNNFKKIMTKFLMNDWYNYNPRITDLKNCDNTTGTINNIAPTAIANCFNSVCSDNQIIVPTGGDTSWDGLIVAVGTGTTEPTLNDYNLESPVSHTDMPVSSSSFGVTANYTKQFTYVMQNATDAAITVSELGLFLRSSAITTGLTRLCCLLGREVLDEPVTVLPNQTATFTYEFSFD